MTRRTPGLDVHGDHRLRCSLWLSLLLLLVLSQTLFSDSSSLGILFLVATEQVDVVIVVVRLAGGRSLGKVQRRGGCIRAICGVCLGGITGQSSEVTFVRGEVLVPSSGVRVLLLVWGRLERLEAGDIGLGWGVAVM
jgi:hypothetical protein